MVGKQNRGVRNKVRQIILIDGHPDYLYKKSSQLKYIVIINDRRFNLGKIGTEFINCIKDMPGVTIESERQEVMHTRGIDGIKGLKIRKLPDSTTIEVSEKDNDSLANKVNDVKNKLLEQGIESVERCSWVCVVDKAKENESLNTDDVISNNNNIIDNTNGSNSTNNGKNDNLREIVRKLNLR